MDMLESFYELDFSKLNIYERKVQSSEHKKRLIFGPPRSGKSFLLFSEIKKLKKGKALYIDCADPRISIKELQNSVAYFMKIKKIELLAIDNHRLDFELPECENIIITSSTITQIDGYEAINLLPLDFEEYLNFERRYTNITNSFNQYLKDGSLPEIPFLHDSLKTKRLQELALLCVSSHTEYEAYKLLATGISRKVTTFQLFNELKTHTRISKDTFYALISRFLSQKIIYLIEKALQPNATKKLYFYDFAFKSALSFQKDFAGVFENMIFLELAKREPKIHYDDSVDFIVPELAIYKLPFGQSEQISTKLDKSKDVLEKLKIKRALFVTLGFEDDGVYDGIEYEAIPFWEWAVSENDN